MLRVAEGRFKAQLADIAEVAQARTSLANFRASQIGADANLLQREAALRSKASFEVRLKQAGFGPITTEILEAPAFFYAEEYHQQYLFKGGVCNRKSACM